MKTTTPLLGVLVALVAAILIHVFRTASSEVSSIMIGCILVIPTGIIGVMYRREQVRNEQMQQRGLHHYRHHIHHRKVIKKTS